MENRGVSDIDAAVISGGPGLAPSDLNDIKGKYITINVWNSYFRHAGQMILEHFDNEEYDNTVFILGTYCFYPFWSFRQTYAGKRLIVYQMEQLFATNPPDMHWVDVGKIVSFLTDFTTLKGEGDEIWDMCEANAAFLKEHGLTVDKTVPLRFTKSLEELNEVEPEIDLLFYGNLNQRRGSVLADLAYYLYHQDVTFIWLYGADFERQKKYIERAKIILNIHHTSSFNRQEQPRIFYAVINKKCVLSEPSQINYFREGIVESDVHNMLGSIIHLLQDDNYKEQANLGYELLKNKEYS